MKTNKIRLNEAQLQRVIKESVKKVLKEETDRDDYMTDLDYYSDPDVWDDDADYALAQQEENNYQIDNKFDAYYAKELTQAYDQFCRAVNVAEQNGNLVRYIVNKERYSHILGGMSHTMYELQRACQAYQQKENKIE